MNSRYQLHLGDCLDVMKALPDVSVDSIVTDPPYGLGFMGKKWDIGVPAVDVFIECLRILKPGGHLLAFGGSRTYHRMAVAVEDAGFEIRDQVMWLYGSGFPKSQNVSKYIDKAAGAEREVLGTRTVSNDIRGGNLKKGSAIPLEVDITAPATDAARQWDGWGTALKPGHEPIVVARKPLIGTVSANVLEHATGALNIDGCRVATEDSTRRTGSAEMGYRGGSRAGSYQTGSEAGRWPANVIHDGSDEVVAAFPAVGTAARFFYAAKASKKDREEGLDAFQATHRPNGNKWTDQDYRVASGGRPPSAESGPRRNVHPTVKPTDLMAYLCRLVTPPGGTILDPFMGSGSTGKAAMREGFQFIGIEREVEYFEIADARVAHALSESVKNGVSEAAECKADMFGGAA